METQLPEKLPDEKSPVRFVKIWLERKLNDWTWQLTKTKHIVLINNKTSETFILDKVRLMSFMKFTISALDKMRIEENKLMRSKIKEVKGKVKEIKEKHKARQQSLFVKAKKIK